MILKEKSNYYSIKSQYWFIATMSTCDEKRMSIYLDGWHGVSPPAAEGVPHGGMGGARTEIYHARTHRFVHAIQFANKKVLIVAMNLSIHKLGHVGGS